MSRYLSRRKQFLALKESYETRTGNHTTMGTGTALMQGLAANDRKICPPQNTLDRIWSFVKPAGSDDHTIPPAERGVRIGSYLPDLHTTPDAPAVYVHVPNARKVFRLGMFSTADSEVTGGRLAANEEVDIDSISYDTTKFPPKITDLSEHEIVFNALRASSFLPKQITSFVNLRFLYTSSEKKICKQPRMSAKMPSKY